MSEEQREMTLREWCEELPDFHLVNTQFAKVQSVLDAAVDACERAEFSSQERFNTQDENGFYFKLGQAVRDLGKI